MEGQAARTARRQCARRLQWNSRAIGRPPCTSCRSGFGALGISEADLRTGATKNSGATKSSSPGKTIANEDAGRLYLGA